jgi:hypothetical protein
MADTVNAVVSESFTLANSDTSYLPGAVIKDMPANQHADLVAVGLLRNTPATEAEITGEVVHPVVSQAAPSDAAPVPTTKTAPDPAG